MGTRVLSGDTGGFTLLEVLIAIVILGICLLGVQAAVTDRFVRDIGGHDRQAVAAQLVEDRIQAIQLDPVYATLETRYEGSDSTIPGFPGFTRTTEIVQVRSVTPRGVVDYRKATVTVRSRNLARPVSRTITVGAP
ncbi:MAG TPA: prepilin-type N-terminal cleavage/methylation domain-containing protein [Longimicrobiaceae bacterium]